MEISYRRKQRQRHHHCDIESEDLLKKRFPLALSCPAYPAIGGALPVQSLHRLLEELFARSGNLFTFMALPY